jgi:cobyrinic acid a,c-diamide synthase
MPAPVHIPRLVLAGVSSGAGKTTAAVGLCRALQARGLRVAMFKCGPDYLDPTYHQRAAGAASHNLDGWLMGRDAVLATFTRASAGADVALVEGVMGLYDGASPTGEEGSTAEIAKWLSAPVVLLADASGMARSLAALVAGFAGFDPELQLAAVIANRVGSRGHLELLGKALRSPPLLGGLPRAAEHAFPDRHLGLRTADRDAVPEALFQAWGALVAEWWNVDALIARARAAPPLVVPSPAPAEAPAAAETTSAGPPRCRIGVAFDEAFHFYYEDNLRRLAALGADLVPFSPVRDAQLPEVDGLYIGGGYPELHAPALAANHSMQAQLRAFAARGRPVYAECGGLMYLCQGIRGLDGQLHPMVGLLPGEAVMSDKLEALGYVEVETQAATCLGGPGLRFRGHQFRYSRLVGGGGDVAGAAADLAGADLTYAVRRRRGGATAAEGYRAGSVLGSYVHAHWASNPLVAEGFVRSCIEQRRSAR